MFHKVTLIGNLGRDPEMRYAPGGEAVTSLNVACSRKYTDRAGQAVKETVWFRVSVWGKQAETCNAFLKKGSLVLVEGRLTGDKATGGPRVYEKSDGTAGAAFEITAQDVRFLSSSGEAAPSDAAAAAPDDEAAVPF